MIDTHAQMRAVVCDGKANEVRVLYTERPERRSGEILIGVQAAAIAADEVAGAERPVTGRRVPGRVGAGIVLFGAGSIVAGTRVGFGPALRCRTCRACRSRSRVRCEQQQVFGVDLPGALADVVAIPRTAIVPLPAAVTPAQGAAALLRWPAALRMVRDAGGLDSGDRVAVLGANRPLGVAAVQLAEAFQAEVVADAGGAGISGGPFDLVLVAGTTAEPLEAVLGHLRAGGTVVFAAGTVAPEAVDLGRLIDRQQRVVGSAGATEADVRSIREWLATSGARPVIAGRYPLEHAGDALAHAAREPAGEVIVDVSEEPCE